MSTVSRPPVNIRFRFNIETGQIEDFIIDDNAIAADEDYHDRVAAKIAGLLANNPEIFATGPRRRAEALVDQHQSRENGKDRETLTSDS